MKDLIDQKQTYVEVAVPLPIMGTFTYRVDGSLENQIQVGVRVMIPFRNREIIGYVVQANSTDKAGKAKSILKVLDEKPVITAKMLELAKWIAAEYGAAWGEVIENALPRWIKYGKKAERALKKEKEIAEASATKPQDYDLSQEQREAFAAIKSGLKEANPKPILLFGVTGSGKSEVYIRSIREVIAKGQGAIVLVPEIALTEQLRTFFYAHFGHDLEILHSKLNDTERFLAWRRLESGKKKVILGPRSAVFAPIPNLGLIIMDEEHENSYKQETTPRYHAREVAKWRAKNEKALFIMGSATPSLETMYASKRGDVIKIDLPYRIDSKAMPQVTVLDMTRIHGGPKYRPLLSPRLVSEIEQNLQDKQGTLLLLNRRGFSTSIHCTRCGQIESCTACEVSLTFHQEDDVLLCHYCNFRKEVGDTCVHCGASLLKFAGFGTEKVESTVAARWPQARIARLDTDSVRKKGSHEKILTDFRNKKIDILIGTQMIAKGFDFQHVTLVGVVLADVGLMLPDFRSSERTFQLLTQVAGRAGRGQIPGRVFIQTYSAGHPSIRYAKDHDYNAFYDYEKNSRYEHGYPPYSRLINFIFRAKEEKDVYLYARQFRDQVRDAYGGNELLFDKRPEMPEILGPSPLPFYRLRGQFRWHVMLKYKSKPENLVQLWQVVTDLKKSSKVMMAIDVDPANIL